jgi:transposase
MTNQDSSVNQTVCHVVQVHYLLPEAICDRCGQLVARFTTAGRTAIDIHLNHPILIHLTVSVHYCPSCHHYFRIQPPFLRRNAIYTNQVVHKAVHSVYEDGMAIRRVTARMARDFWVQPSEGAIRAWCRDYSATFDFVVDYQPWVVGEFSGILCIDEVYQDQLALLLAADPAAPDGDRLVGYQLVHGPVDARHVEDFLSHLKAIGIEPEEVITDGSQLYPPVLAQVWPQAAHQLCLFHETRRITQATRIVIREIRRRLPHPPPATSLMAGGPLRVRPPKDDQTDPATQRWYWRQLQRHIHIRQVHELAQHGLSQRAIARQTGHHRRTIKIWVAQPVPELPAEMPVELSAQAAVPPQRQRRLQKQQLHKEVHNLAAEGDSCSAIARQVGIHRITVKRWLQQALSPTEEENPPEREAKVEPTAPPMPWSNWEEVRQVREALQEHRFLLLKHPKNLTVEEQAQVDTLLSSPVGGELQVARSFLVDWYQLWCDEAGQRPSLLEAHAHYEAWRTNRAYQALPQLRRVLDQMTESKFQQLSQCLRHPDWEATNNGAERTGRAFRHLQSPHFNLRTQDSIENALKVAACLRKEEALRSKPEPFHNCQRGRHRHPNPLAV